VVALQSDIAARPAERPGIAGKKINEPQKCARRMIASGSGICFGWLWRDWMWKARRVAVVSIA